MLGRGILQNPFLAEELIHFAESGKQKTERKNETLFFENSISSRFINFYNDYSQILVSLKNEKIALASLKELWHYFAAFRQLTPLELHNLLIINDYQKFIMLSKNVLSKRLK
jgi:tRNA-dihydrouridine synthase